MSEHDRYCHEAAAVLELARFVSFLPDKDALITEAQQLLRRAFAAGARSSVAVDRSYHCPATAAVSRLGGPYAPISAL